MLSLEQTLGVLALITSCIGLFPQAYRAYRIKSTNDLSYFMLINSALCAITWLWYGHLSGAGFVTLANVACLLASVILIGQKVYYDKRNTGI